LQGPDGGIYRPPTQLCLLMEEVGMNEYPHECAKAKIKML
jgi:hypothetical protein